MYVCGHTSTIMVYLFRGQNRTLKKLLVFMCIGALLAYISVGCVRSLKTGVTDGCELPCGCWKLNPGPLKDQPKLLITEPSFQPFFSPFG